MIGRKLLFTVVSLLSFGANQYAQAQTAAPPLARYPDIKTHFNKRLSQALTNEQRLDLYRETVAQGRYSGEPMLKNKFHNFDPGKFNLSPTTPGLAKNVLLLASDNRNVVIGNARTLRYAMSLQGDGRFNVAELNQTRKNAAGKTDADIVFRHKPTGLQVRVEVKNMTPTSQLANLPKIQSQILKMAEDARISGEMQVWANRKKVLPEVRAFAEQHGVRVEDRLRTGKKNMSPSDRSFQDFMNSLDKDLWVQAKVSALAGGVKAGMGVFLAYQAIQFLANDIANFGDSKGGWLRIGEHGSMLLAGGGLSTAGAAQLARQIPALANNTRLVSLTKWGGRLGVAGTVLAEGFLIGQYFRGDLTNRQFWHGQASLGGGLAGGVGSGYTMLWIVKYIKWLGPWGKLAAVGLAAFGGGYAGAHFAGRGVEGLYSLQDAKQQEMYAQFLLRHYQSP